MPGLALWVYSIRTTLSDPGPQFHKNDPPQIFGWLRACDYHINKEIKHAVALSCSRI